MSDDLVDTLAHRYREDKRGLLGAAVEYGVDAVTVVDTSPEDGDLLVRCSLADADDNAGAVAAAEVELDEIAERFDSGLVDTRFGGGKRGVDFVLEV